MNCSIAQKIPSIKHSIVNSKFIFVFAKFFCTQRLIFRIIYRGLRTTFWKRASSARVTRNPLRGFRATRRTCWGFRSPNPRCPNPQSRKRTGTGFADAMIGQNAKAFRQPPVLRTSGDITSTYATHTLFTDGDYSYGTTENRQGLKTEQTDHGSLH